MLSMSEQSYSHFYPYSHQGAEPQAPDNPRPHAKDSWAYPPKRCYMKAKEDQ